MYIKDIIWLFIFLNLPINYIKSRYIKTIFSYWNFYHNFKSIKYHKTNCFFQKKEKKERNFWNSAHQNKTESEKLKYTFIDYTFPNIIF